MFLKRWKRNNTFGYGIGYHSKEKRVPFFHIKIKIVHMLCEWTRSYKSCCLKKMLNIHDSGDTDRQTDKQSILHNHDKWQHCCILSSCLFVGLIPFKSLNNAATDMWHEGLFKAGENTFKKYLLTRKRELICKLPKYQQQCCS